MRHHITKEKMMRKSVIKEPEYNLVWFDNASDLTQTCWKLQGFFMRKDSTVKGHLSLATEVWKGFSLGVSKSELEYNSHSNKFEQKFKIQSENWKCLFKFLRQL